MLINWFTVVAQAVNFLILIYLLKRFLYTPVIRVMDERDKKIADAFDRAVAAEKEAKRNASELAKEKESFTAAKEKLFAEARKEVEEWRDQAIKGARDEVDVLRNRWIDLVTREKESFLNGLRARIILKVMSIGEKVLRELARADIDKRIVAVFLERISKGKNVFQLDEIEGEVVFQTGFPLEAETENETRDSIRQQFQDVREVTFEVSESLGMGVKFVAGDRQIEWNLAQYLDGLEQEIMNDFSSMSKEKA